MCVVGRSCHMLMVPRNRVFFLENKGGGNKAFTMQNLEGKLICIIKCGQVVKQFFVFSQEIQR